jgi:hypothetical protein
MGKWFLGEGELFRARSHDETIGPGGRRRNGQRDPHQANFRILVLHFGIRLLACGISAVI